MRAITSSRVCTFADMHPMHPIHFAPSQILPPVLMRKWESTPDFKAFLGKSGAASARTGWATSSGSGRGVMAGPPSLVGSPGRSEIARGVRYSSRSGSVDDLKVSSPQLQPQARQRNAWQKMADRVLYGRNPKQNRTRTRRSLFTLTRCFREGVVYCTFWTQMK